MARHTFQINLNPNYADVQSKKMKGTNLLDLSIRLPQHVKADECTVQIEFSVNGMLGMGIELIRKAMRIKTRQVEAFQEMEELMPISPTGGY